MFVVPDMNWIKKGVYLRTLVSRHLLHFYDDDECVPQHMHTLSHCFEGNGIFFSSPEGKERKNKKVKMASVVGSTSHLAFMMKDVGQKLTIWAHYLKSHRVPVPVLRHQNVRVYRHMMPWVQDCGFIAPSAMVMGNVVLGHDTVIFYHAIVRNFHTKEATHIGDHTAVMDRVSFLGQVQVGSNSYIGQGATLDCCNIGEGVYIGAGAAIALGAVIENGAMIAPGSVVDKDTRVPAGELWAGVPAVKVGEVTPEQHSEVHHIVHEQVRIAKEHSHAIHDHEHATEELGKEWLDNAIQMMEAQQREVKVHTSVDIPIEAKRFLQPRVHFRRPEMHMRMSYPVNRVAPWMTKFADQCANV